MRKLSRLLREYGTGNGRRIRGIGRRIRGIGVAAFLISLAILNCEKFKKDVFIPRTTIQSAIEKKFPYDKSAIIARTTLTDPEIYFSDSAVGVKLKYWANLLEKEINGKLDLNGVIDYRKGKVYMKDLEIVELTMEEKEFDSKGKLIKIFKSMLNNYLDCYPVYTLDQSDFKQNLAKMLLKDITIKGDSLCITIGL